MNAARRARIRAARKTLRNVCDEIVAVRDEEDEARDNMPENLAYSERYEQSEECSEAMNSTIDLIEEAIESLDDAI